MRLEEITLRAVEAKAGYKTEAELRADKEDKGAWARKRYPPINMVYDADPERMNCLAPLPFPPNLRVCGDS